MNKIFNNFLFSSFTALLVFLALFAGSARLSFAAKSDNSLFLKSVLVSGKGGSRFIWFKFNKKPQNFNPGYLLNKYSLTLTFKNTYPVMGAKFIKFNNNRLFSGLELVPLKNLDLNAVLFFNKGVTVNKKDIRGSFYKNFFIIKISDGLAGSIFKNIGKKPAPAELSMLPVKKRESSPPPDRSIKTKKSSAMSLSPASKNGNNLNIGFEIIKTIIYLALVLGLIYGIYYLLAKFKGKAAVKKNLNNLRLVSSLNLGNKKSVLLIEVNGELFLVGVSPSNIQVIGHIKDSGSNYNSSPSVVSMQSASGDKAPHGSGSAVGGGDTAAAAYGGKFNRGQYEPSVRADYESGREQNGDFANILKSQLNQKESADLNSNARFEADRQNDAGSYKIKNISEARFKNKTDNVFFDIEEKLKGLIENDGNGKKF